MKLLQRIALAVAAVFIALPTLSSAKGGSGGRSSGSVHVNGYTKKDGTYVAPHYRSAPNGTKSDNWSTKGNVNPYTGKEGTKNADASAPQKPSEPKPTAPAPQRSLATVKRGATPAEVTAAVGEPNIKTSNKWYYKDAGTVVFEDGKVASVAQQ